MARMERTIKRLWITIILLISLLVASNGAWLWYESQWDYYDTEIMQENENGVNNYVGEDGNIYNGDKAFNFIEPPEESNTDDTHSGPEA